VRRKKKAAMANRKAKQIGSDAKKNFLEREEAAKRIDAENKSIVARIAAARKKKRQGRGGVK
jgi:hypothetical protein